MLSLHIKKYVNYLSLLTNNYLQTGLRYRTYAEDEIAIITTAPSLFTDITQNHYTMMSHTL